MRKNPEDLHCQGLRLPLRARALLDALANDLARESGRRISAAEVTRGLVLLALYCGYGSASRPLARAFLRAAREPTDEGARKALKELRLAERDPLEVVDDADGAPATERTPPTQISPTGSKRSP